MSEGSDAVATWSMTSSEQRAAKESPERRKLRNEDSSYDSDFEPCDLMSPQEAHEDISRTVSETLGAEFDEYVTIQGPKDPRQAKHLLPESRKLSARPDFKSCSGDGSKTAEGDNEGIVSFTMASIMASPDYPQRVEFGVKLGYSESLVQLALTKLAPNPDKNQLLDELIRLDAGAPTPQSEGENTQPQPTKEEADVPMLRSIVIDGSNVAMSHGNQTTFSCRGIKLCVDWFRARGHKEITVFVPQFRKEASKVDSVITDRELLVELERDGFLCFTPSKSISGKRIVAYDDRYVLKEAANVNGVVVSNDNYRDLMNEKEAYRKVVEESLLMYSWVKGRFEPPEDPFGRNGPSLDVFLRRSMSKSMPKEAKTCPYGRKCTYGNKCKFTHPERGTAPVKSVTQRLQEHAQRHYQEKEKAISRDPSPGDILRSKTLSLPVTGDSNPIKRAVARTHSTVPNTDYFPKAVREEGPLSTCSLNLKQSTLSVLSTVGQRSLDGMGATSKSQIGLPTYVSQMNLGGAPSWNCYMEPKQHSTLPLGKMSLIGQLSEQEAMSSDNRHMKLQRQLSINPVHDARLSKKFLVEDSASYMPAGSSQPLNQKFIPQHFSQDEQLPSRSHVRSKQMMTPFFNYQNNDLVQPNYHTPVTRHSSSQDSKPGSSYTLYPPYVHNHVTRNLSAPDAVWGSHHPPVKYHTRLNSTSDSHLNIHAGESFCDPFDEPGHNISYPTTMPSVPTNPGPIGSRPMSPQQAVTALHHPHLMRMPQITPMTTQQMSPKTYEDERFKIFYHLSQLFPEALVRSALIRNPQETDPTKICASILNIPSDHVNTPVQSGPMGQFTLSTGNDQLRGAFSHPVETARIEAYSSLSKLFLEDQVRKVLAAYPDETDPTKLCMLLVALNSNPT